MKSMGVTPLTKMLQFLQVALRGCQRILTPWQRESVLSRESLGATRGGLRVCQCHRWHRRCQCLWCRSRRPEYPWACPRLGAR